MTKDRATEYMESVIPEKEWISISRECNEDIIESAWEAGYMAGRESNAQDIGKTMEEIRALLAKMEAKHTEEMKAKTEKILELISAGEIMVNSAKSKERERHEMTITALELKLDVAAEAANCFHAEMKDLNQKLSVAVVALERIALAETLDEDAVALKALGAITGGRMNDTKRLDWLIQNERVVRENPQNNYYFLNWIDDMGIEHCQEKDYKTARQAIDAAMEE